MKRKGKIQFKAKNAVKGFLLNWTDSDPLNKELDTVIDIVISHRNPTIRHRARQVWKEQEQNFINQRALLWKITITAYFPFAETMVREQKLQVVEHMVFTKLSTRIDDAITALCEDGASVDRADFQVECLGMRQAQPGDYDEGMEPDDDASDDLHINNQLKVLLAAGE